jgi:outer membrane protein insertion porin family
MAALVAAWLAAPAAAQTPPGNEPPPAAPSNIPAPTQPAPTNPANPQPPAPDPNRNVVPTAPAPSPTPAAPAQTPAPPTAVPGAVPTPAPASPAATQTAGQVTLCGQPVPPPARLPPAGSGPVILAIAPCFEKQGGTSAVEPQTYLYYIQTRPSLPSQNQWVPYDDAAEDKLHADFRALWATNFLDDLSIEVTDYVLSNGVIGKLVKYDLEERQRIKIVDYAGSKQLESTKIDEKLKEENVTIRLDSFVDDALIRRVKGIVRGMLSEKGYLDSTVTHAITPVTGGTKTVNLTFTIKEGPKYKIRAIDFVGNKDVSDRKLRAKMKDTKSMSFLSWITQRGTYKADKYAEDAEKVVGYYRDNGYLRVRVDNPEVRTLKDTKDGKTRYVELRIPVTEGPRYMVGSVMGAHNKVVKSEPLVQIFNLQTGKYYSEKRVKKGMEKAREIYGSIGYFEFTAFPDFSFRDLPKDAQPKSMEEAQRATADPAAKPGPPIVDVTMHMQEGEQYFVNRITFLGNTTTHDNVIRREMQLVESGVFNTEALKQSVKHLNQLGYFKALEGNEGVQVDKTPGEKNKVDVKLKLEEQNRNQLTFGAGVSQFEGAFAQFAFQTSNFLGKGETLSLSVLAGKRYKDYQLSFSEPFLFDKPITGGVNIFNRTIDYIGAFTQESSGGNVLAGFRVANFSRLFMQYSYERVGISNLSSVYTDDPTLVNRNPFLADALLLGTSGKRTISKISPSFVLNTVDNPIFPSAGRRLTASFDLAGMGGNTSFYKPRLEAIQYFQQTRKLSAGVRGEFAFVAPWRGTPSLPIFERLVEGGEYSVRGFDIRSIGPRDSSNPDSPLVIGGNKSLLFNGEYVYQIAGPVRILAFFDATQVRNEGEGFRSSAFIASTGGELRFFMPVLNVPFRLIFARNINRDGILDNNYQPEKKWRFRFAVGSTF